MLPSQFIELQWGVGLSLPRSSDNLLGELILLIWIGVNVSSMFYVNLSHVVNLILFYFIF